MDEKAVLKIVQAIKYPTVIVWEVSTKGVRTSSDTKVMDLSVLFRILLPIVETEPSFVGGKLINSVSNVI